ncbi:UNVERIFIED_CONTAM: hypothetical protein Sangu_2593000, partial [Sesamum angustifolium]
GHLSPSVDYSLPATWDSSAALSLFSPPAAERGSCSFLNPPQEKKKQSLPVIIMPGDDVPKFIAVPCPCEPPRSDEIVVEMRRPPPKPPGAVNEFSCSTSRNMVN